MVYTFGILSLCQSSLQTITRIKHIIKFTCDSKSYTCTSKNCTFGQKKRKNYHASNWMWWENYDGM